MIKYVAGNMKGVLQTFKNLLVSLFHYFLYNTIWPSFQNFRVYFMDVKQNNVGGSVAEWLSEKVLRGRGPDRASGFESHRRRIFSKEGTSAGPWMCVYVSSGLTVGWWKEESTLFRPPPRGQH
jgi:hypothetical protein